MITGSEITIVGTNFDPIASNNVVKINGVVAKVNSATATTLAITIPTAATSGKITVNKGAVAATSSNDFMVMNNPYQNVRIKYITTIETKIRRLFHYDSSNRLTSIETCLMDNLGTLNIQSINTYTYLPDGKLDKDTYKIISPASNTSTVDQYTYVGNVLDKITNSTIDETTASSPIVTINSIEKYDFIKGSINTITRTDSQGKILFINKYAYAIIAGNPQIVLTQTPGPGSGGGVSSRTTLYSGDVLNPLSLTIPTVQESLFFEKSYAFSQIADDYTFFPALNQETGRITDAYFYINKITKATQNYQYEDK
jgi:hypothetical protein